MRVALLLALALSLPPIAFAQEQESKLVDRLLRPNTELQSAEQTKKFGGGATVNSKQADVRAFYIRDRALAKNFLGLGRVATPSAESRSFQTSKSTAYLGSRSAVPYSKFNTRNSQMVRTAYDSNKKSEPRQFATATFEARGKSQKSLSAEKHAMTIDEVRELLNKSK